VALWVRHRLWAGRFICLTNKAHDADNKRLVGYDGGLRCRAFWVPTARPAVATGEFSEEAKTEGSRANHGAKEF